MNETKLELIDPPQQQTRALAANATPADYGKSGKRSFLLQIDAKGISHVSSKDNGGKPLRN